MVLSPDYTYVVIDFETTGLDVSKDEPIQIGLISFDVHGTILDSYVSYILPEKQRSDLKDVVSVLTGLSLQDILQHGVARSVVSTHIQRFFGSKTVLIGHNVAFDVSFLRTYFPSLSFCTTLDTYPLAQAFVHYVGSYSLETIVQKLASKESFASFLATSQKALYGDTPHKNFHDALYDSLLTMALFLYCMRRFAFVLETYPEITSVFSRVDDLQMRSLFVVDTGADTPYCNALPLLVKPVSLGTQKPAPTPVSCDLSDQPFGQSMYVGDMSFVDVLRCILPGQRVILAFSHLQKLDIAKKICTQLGYDGLGYLKDEQIISIEKMRQFLSQKSFSWEEFLFVCKRCSHHEQGLRVLEVTNSTDAAILYFLQQPAQQQIQDIVLATHGGVYALVDDPLKKQLYAQHVVCFFDADRRYTSYNLYANAEFDVYTLLDALERVVYTYRVLSQHQPSYKDAYQTIAQFTSLFSIFVGVFGIEVTQQFSGISQDLLVFHAIADSDIFRRTGILWSRMRHAFTRVMDTLLPEHVAYILPFFTKLADLFAGVVRIRRKIYGIEGLYYTIAFDVSYTDFAEFLDVFHDMKLRLFSSYNAQYTSLSSRVSHLQYVPMNYIAAQHHMFRIADISSVVEKCGIWCAEKTPANIFILSTAKHRSQALVSAFRSCPWQKHVLLLAENITGGVKKHVAKAHDPAPKILVGGYAFLLSFLAAGRKFDKCILFHILGPLEKVLIRDIIRYKK